MQSALHRLTETHSIEINRDDGTTLTATAAPLLEQLRNAIFGEDGRNGGSAESRGRLPLSAPALDLYELVDNWVTELWVQRFQRVPGAEHPEQLLTEWVKDQHPDSPIFYTVKVTIPTTLGKRIESELTTSTVHDFILQVEHRIVELLERPTVQVPVAGPCPAPRCWATTVTRWIDGEPITSHTLEFTREQRTGDTLSVACSALSDSGEKYSMQHSRRPSAPSTFTT